MSSFLWQSSLSLPNQYGSLFVLLVSDNTTLGVFYGKHKLAVKWVDKLVGIEEVVLPEISYSLLLKYYFYNKFLEQNP